MNDLMSRSKTAYKIIKRLLRENVTQVTPQDFDVNNTVQHYNQLLHSIAIHGGIKFWATLPAINLDALIHLKNITAAKFIVLSSPTKNYSDAYEGKRLWVEMNLRPILEDRLAGFIITKDKSVYTNPRSILIDDRLKHTENWSSCLLYDTSTPLIEQINSFHFQSKKVIYIDLDGCFADLATAVSQQVNYHLTQKAKHMLNCTDFQFKGTIKAMLPCDFPWGVLAPTDKIAGLTAIPQEKLGLTLIHQSCTKDLKKRVKKEGYEIYYPPMPQIDVTKGTWQLAQDTHPQTSMPRKALRFVPDEQQQLKDWVRQFANVNSVHIDELERKRVFHISVANLTGVSSDSPR